MKLIADILFDAIVEQQRAEIQTDDALVKLFNLDTMAYSDIVYDAYDSSFEIKDVNSEWTPTPEELKCAWEMGFSRCWICYTDGTERYASTEVPLGEKYPSA